MGSTLRPVLQASLPMACLAAVLALPLPAVRAQMPMDPHEGHDDPHREHRMQESPPSGGVPGHDHSAHMHDVGPAGDTYDLRFIEAS